MIRIAYMEISISKRRRDRGHLRVKVPWSGIKYISPRKAALLRAFLDKHFPAKPSVPTLGCTHGRPAGRPCPHCIRLFNRMEAPEADGRGA